MMLRQLETWFDHVAWADARALAALRLSGGQPPRALEIFAHVLGAEHVWLHRMLERAPAVAVWPQLDIEQCAELARLNTAAYRELLHGFSEADVERTVHYRNSAGTELDSKVIDMLSQVCLHGSYHRGQIALLLRDAGFEPSPTDYIVFMRGAPAATRAS